MIEKLIKLLKKQDQDADVFAYLGAKEGWQIVELGYGDTIIGKGHTKSKEFVLIPVTVPEKFEKWAKDDKAN